MKDIILLHGALGTGRQMEALARSLNDNYTVHTLTFSGHGGEPDVDQFTIPLFAYDVLNYISKNNIHKPDVFGYSMGGYVALYMAVHHPEKINRLITLATKFAWDEETAWKESKRLDPAVISGKIPAFAEYLKTQHKDWENVLLKTSEMMKRLVENKLKDNDLIQIKNPCMLMVGDRDKMVSINETVETYKHIKGCLLTVLPGTPHPMELADIDLIRFYVQRMFN